MARTVVVGDVHGMLPELKSLVSTVGLTKDDVLVFVGDLVDKGPDSAGVVRFARELRDGGFNVVLVKGNHEDKHAMFRSRYAKGGAKAVAKLKGVAELTEITEALSPEDVTFLDSAIPFHHLPDEVGGGVVVHGGITSDMTELNPEDPNVTRKLLRTRYVTGKAKARINIEFILEGSPAESAEDLSPEELARRALEAIVTKTQVRPAGSFLKLGDNGPDDLFWAELYDGRFGHVYFGHDPRHEETAPVEYPHATALDLGAVFGGHLAAVVLEPGKPRESVVIPSSGKYAEPLDEDE